MSSSQHLSKSRHHALQHSPVAVSTDSQSVDTGENPNSIKGLKANSESKVGAAALEVQLVLRPPRQAQRSARPAPRPFPGRSATGGRGVGASRQRCGYRACTWERIFWVSAILGVWKKYIRPPRKREPRLSVGA